MLKISEDSVDKEPSTSEQEIAHRPKNTLLRKRALKFLNIAITNFTGKNRTAVITIHAMLL